MGKSTMLRDLSAERARGFVAGYAFVTLNLVVNVVLVAENRSPLGGRYGGAHITVLAWFMR
jgi:GTPase involved in cell partitioning and DNA repair